MAVVYFVQRRDGAIKIGTTAHLRARLASLTREHGTLAVLGLMRGGFTEETQTHKRFEDARLGGEWFSPSTELLSFIREKTQPMGQSSKKDNQTFRHKKALRMKALELLRERGIEQPVVMETHGGAGKLWNACYSMLPQGVVMEKDAAKAARLGKQRPTWAVYECDCVEALQAGVGAHLTIDLLDCDPYGEVWPTLDAFFTSERPLAPVMALVVNDGLRQTLALGRAWATGSLRDVVARRGNDLHPVYLDVCEELVNEKAASAGYRIDRFAGYHVGDKQNMTHFLAVLVKDG